MIVCAKCGEECTRHYYIMRDDRILCPECWDEETKTDKEKQK